MPKIVKSCQQLQTAIDQATPGDVILVAFTRLSGNFIINKSGLPESPITIKAEKPNTKVVGNGAGTAFTIMGTNWNIQSFIVSGYDLAFHVKGARNTLTGIVVDRCERGLNIEGKDTTASGLVLHKATIRVAASFVILSKSVINGNGRYKPIITFEEETFGGMITGNTINGAVVLKGDEYVFNENLIIGQTQNTGVGNDLSVDNGNMFT